MSFRYLKGLLFAAALAVSQNAVVHAQASFKGYGPEGFITTHINSGNPNYPFPQFMEYAGGGKSLAKYNAEGVTHADMEKSMREGYEIMMHRCTYGDETLGGTRYIKFNAPEVPENNNTFCSEGDGYALLAAAIFADKPTFDGLWLWMHDNRMSRVYRYADGKPVRMKYRYTKDGQYLPGWLNDASPAYNTDGDIGDNNSATDGDFDVAMGLLLAYRQWGEFMGIEDSKGNKISYKKDAEAVMNALVDTFMLYNLNGGKTGYMSGDIGIDGYVKNGNTWRETTEWRTSSGNTKYAWGNTFPESESVGGLYPDYVGPSYFHAFADYLEQNKGTKWCINQYRRAEASSDWLIGEAYRLGGIASAGSVTFNADQTACTAFNFHPSGKDGEDFRFAWRTILNYLWYGNPKTTWDPVTHEAVAGGNTYEYDMALRHAARMKEPLESGAPKCGKLGASPDLSCPGWKGIVHVPQCWTPDGTAVTPTQINFNIGAGAPAAVASGDLELLGDVYRQAELMWDDANKEAKMIGTDDYNKDSKYRYENSTPIYFHGWFRLLGMLACSGNLQSPDVYKKAANMKVYMSVDKTYAYLDDKVTYTVQYRNYGSADASGVVITTPLDKDYKFVSCNKGGKYDAASHSIKWSIGSVPGFKTGALDATIDSVQFTVMAVETINPRVCLQSTISGSNFDDWVSNEYPNHATYTMERNCVDILASRSLAILKKSNREKMNPNDIVRFTVEFENKSEGESSWLNGGRDNVVVSYGNFLPMGLNESGAYMNTSFYQYYRLWHDAAEAYVDISNYRISYFLNDTRKGLRTTDNPNGWWLEETSKSDTRKYGYNPNGESAQFVWQKLPAGKDGFGSWNQRIVTRLPHSLTAPASHIYLKLDHEDYIHKGVIGPGFFRIELKTDPAANMRNAVQDDWSYNPDLQNLNLDGQSSRFTPISPSFANYNHLDSAITNYARHVCDPDVKNYDRVLVEEFDGYTWRRIAGRGPLPGKEAYDVVVWDTIPKELAWKGFVDSMGLGIKAEFVPAAKGAGYTGIVKWSIPEMLVGEKDALVYECIAKDIDCPADDRELMNVAWIRSKTDSPDSSRVNLVITCSELPPLIDPQTSLFKECSVSAAQTGDVVSYTLTYKNTEGTVVDGDLSSQKGWQKLGSGSIPDASGKFSLDMNKNTVNKSTPYFFGPTRAHGKNGVLETSWDLQNASEFYLVFRADPKGGNPGDPTFKGVALKMSPNPMGKGTCYMEVIDGGTTVAKETQPVAYPLNDDDNGNGSPMNIRVELIDDAIYIYINDFETMLKSYDGISTSSAGYVGIYGNCQQTLTKFWSNFDSSFDLTVSDVLPDELKPVETAIDQKGVFDSKKNTITWPLVEGPILGGDSLKYNFDAEVVSCNKFITNLGVATVFGQDSLKVLNTIECGEQQCALTSVRLNLKKKSGDTTFCATDSIVLRATAKARGVYNYQWYNGKAKVGEAVKGQDTLVVKEAGDYYVLVSSTDDATCKKYSDTAHVAVDTVPLTSLDDVSACVGGSVDLEATEATASEYVYLWSDASSDRTLTVTEDGEYSVTVTNGACSVADTANVTFGSVTLKNGVFTLNGADFDRAVTDTGTICPNTVGELEVNYLSDDGKYEWSSKPKDKGMQTNNNKTAIAPKEVTTYYVKFLQGCEAIDSFVVVPGAPALSGGVFTLNGVDYDRATSDTGMVCPGADNTLKVNYLSDDDSYQWSSRPADASLAASGASAQIAPDVTTTYYVDFVKECAARDSFVIVIGEPMVVEVDTLTKCGSVELTASVDPSIKSPVFAWTKDGEESEVNPLVIDGEEDPSGFVSVVASAKGACQSEPLKVGYQNVDLKVAIDGSPSVCPGLKGTLSAVTTSKGYAKDPSYTYSWTDADGAEVSTDPSALVPAGSYQLKVSDGICTRTASHTLVEGSGEVKGDLTINGKKIVGVGPERTYGSCGEDITISADYVHDANTDFHWTVNGKLLGETGPSFTIPVSEATKVELEFVNQCAAFDEFTITLLDTVPVQTDEKRTCGETQLSATSTARGATFAWFVGGDSIGGKSLTRDVSTTPGAKGTVKVVGSADGFCPSKPIDVDFVVDTLGVSIKGDESVCPLTSASLQAVAASSNASAVYSYSWEAREAGSTSAFKPFAADEESVSSEALDSDTEFRLTVSDGVCSSSATDTVKVFRPERDGEVTADGDAIALVGGVKTLRTCALAPIDLATSYTGTDFAWSLDGEQVGSGKSVTISPSTSEAHTERYILSYVNRCPVTDTVDVAVLPLSVSADYTAFSGLHCEGEDISASLLLQGYSADMAGSYIKWMKDGVEVASAANKESLAITGAKVADGGTYSYEVSNGVCSLPGAAGADDAVVTVMPRIRLTADDKEVIVPRGEDAKVALSSDPASASVSWLVADGSDGSLSDFGSGNPLSIPAISRDYSLLAVASASGYCDDSVRIDVLADAKATVVLRTDSSSVCFFGPVAVVADTTGTGTVRFPKKYGISILMKYLGSDEWVEVSQNDSVSQPLGESASFKSVVTYGSQRAESEVVDVTVFPRSSYSLSYKTRVCEGEPTPITLSNLQPTEAQVIWDDDPTLSSTLGASVEASPMEPTVYIFHVVQNNGVCREDGNVSISPVERVALEPLDTVVCEGASLSLKVATKGSPVYYKWYDAQGKLIAEKASVILHPAGSSVYTVEAGNRVCDSTTTSVNVVISPRPVISSVDVIETRMVHVSATGGEPPYLFAYDAFDFQPDGDVKVGNFGVHVFKVMDDLGCVGSLTDTLKAPEIKVPIFFTPDGDGTDDVFEVPNLATAYPDATVKVFDRWGKQLVEYNAADGGWDGTYKGKKMPATDYWYEIYVPELYKYFTGHFTLLRN